MRSSLVICAAGLLACAAMAAADEPGTRVERWTKLRREKAASVAPPRRSFLERQLLAIERAERPSLLDLNLAGAYPRVQNIATGSETALGFRLWRPDLGRTDLDLHASVFHSIRGYEFYDLQVGRLPHRGARFPARSTRGDDVYELGDLPRLDAGHVSLYASARYQHYPQTAFFGLGPDSRRDRRTNFLYQDALYEMVAGYQGARRGLAANLRAGFLQAFIGPGTDDESPDLTAPGTFADIDTPGLRGPQPDFYHLAASVLLDGRDQPGNPHQGGMIALAAARFDERGGGEYDFDRLSVDTRGYASLGSPQRVLALRVLVSADRRDRAGRVPFYFQQTLGGSRTLRGFPSFRFRGEEVLLLQAEYRWEAWPALELALFADAGRVSGTLYGARGEAFGVDEPFSLRGLEADYGIGVRLKTHTAVLARFDVARSREDTRFLLRLGPSF